MFYDDEFTLMVNDWLYKLAELGHEFNVLIGDPGLS